MADDPSHRAMLYFLEILMNSPSPLTVSQLAGRFGSRNFSPEMRQAAGGNEAGLKKFLLKYPSLFTVSGNLISHNDGTASLGRSLRDTSPASSTAAANLEVSTETEAVQFFRAKLLKKGEKWMPVKSLAGHLSQAPPPIRECVGPQSEFRDWLIKHPLIFEVCDEDVSLKDNIKYSAINPNSEILDDSRTASFNARYSLTPVLDKSFDPPPPSTPKLKKRPKSLEMLDPRSPLGSPMSPTRALPTPSPSPRAGPVTMTANEYKAVMFIKSVLEKKGSMRLGSLSGHFSQAPESLRNTVGWSKPELERFLLSHSNIFCLNDDTVSVIPKARLSNVIITGSRPQASPKPAVTNRKGRIYHVAKLWGIIDLGRHEHVFIDRSIFGKHIDDLNRLLCVGEEVCFDAIPAPKGSRARWRATKVWKENESIEDLIERVASRLQLPLDGVASYREPPSPIANIDEEMRSIIPELNDSSMPATALSVGGVSYAFGDAAPSGTGVVPVWNFKHAELSAMKDVDDLDLDDDSQTLMMVAERYYMNRSVLGDSPRDEMRKQLKEMASLPQENGQTNDKAVANDVMSKPGMVSVSCQTIVTGEILATQLFQQET